MVKPTALFPLLLAFALSVHGGPPEESPSLAALQGQELSRAVANTLPHRDCSTPQKTFLGFLKSNVEANLRDYLFYLTPEARKAIAGVEREDAIPESRGRDFNAAHERAGFHSIKLEDFQAFPNQSPTQIVAVVVSSRGKMTVREKYDIRVVETNGQWKFSAVDVSIVDRGAVAAEP
ncbi:MAG: hypothetical protein M5U15_03660 [Kiritimatiellae bacterium]|nr:hypothetical protein [Kiritimatiellia bacterium]